EGPQPDRRRALRQRQGRQGAGRQVQQGARDLQGRRELGSLPQDREDRGQGLGRGLLDQPRRDAGGRAGREDEGHPAAPAHGHGWRRRRHVARLASSLAIHTLPPPTAPANLTNTPPAAYAAIAVPLAMATTLVRAWAR